MAVGDYITQVGSVHGDLVLQNQRRPTVEPRPRPLERLPAAFSDLLGRDAEVASTISRLGEGRSTCFYGVSGVGKSSVLRHVAHHPAVRSASDGVLHCAGRGQPLADLLQLVFDAFFDAFFDAEMGFTPTPGKVRHYLSSLRVVLVIEVPTVPPSSLRPREPPRRFARPSCPPFPRSALQTGTRTKWESASG